MSRISSQAGALLGYGTLVTPVLEEPAWSLGTQRTKVATEELRGLWQSQQMVLKPFRSTPLPRCFSMGTCKAAWDLWWDSVSSSFSCSCTLWSSARGT